MSTVARQPASMTRTVETVETALSDCGLNAGITPAKRQMEPTTCSQARAVDGADIARNDGRGGNLCVKGLRVEAVEAV